MLKRKAYGRLMEWKDRPGHGPLLVTGQRHVGKTFLIERFGSENYEHVVRLDLSASPEYSSIFFGDPDADSLISRMAACRGSSEFVPGRTLIFLDEIQECPRARAALGSLAQDGRYDVIASGSMTDPETESGTPGREEHLVMYGLDFEEFLWARGRDERDIAPVRERIARGEPLTEPQLNVFSRMFRDYMLVGGMPAAVNDYLANGLNWVASSRTQREILASCKDDISKHNGGIERLKVEECLESIPHQLARANRKFMYADIPGRSGRASRGAAREYSDSLLWIRRAGYGNFCHRLSDIGRPLGSFSVRTQFKVYLSDTGLLMQMYGPEAGQALLRGDLSYNSGAAVENAVAECLMKSGLDRYYYVRNRGAGKMGLDFVLESGKGLVAVVVAAGGNAPHSLEKAAEYTGVTRRIELGTGNIGVGRDGVEHYPLFAAAFMPDIL